MSSIQTITPPPMGQEPEPVADSAAAKILEDVLTHGDIEMGYLLAREMLAQPSCVNESMAREMLAGLLKECRPNFNKIKDDMEALYGTRKQFK